MFHEPQIDFGAITDIHKIAKLFSIGIAIGAFKQTANPLTQQLLVEESKENILTYTPQQLKWCEEHESDIWAHFMERKIFFSSDFQLRLDYINDGPFTKGFPKEAPSRVGVWLGVQIVNSYMVKHPDVTLQQLMNNQDLHQIFNQSGYKPNKK